MSTNFHIRDLVEYIDFASETFPNRAVIDIMIDKEWPCNIKPLKQIRRYYSIDDKDCFVVFIGYDQGIVFNFFRRNDNQIILQAKKGDHDELILRHHDSNSRFDITVDYDATLNAMFKMINESYEERSGNPFATQYYEGMISSLQRYITTMIKVYTRYIKPGKIRVCKRGVI